MDDCWPSDEEWQSLNKSTNFNLVRVVPIASVCYGPNPDGAMCEEVMRMSKNSGWRASQPGKVQVSLEYIPARILGY